MIGGGAAGIIAAWRAASLGAEVTLIEKNERLGIKILISGGGKCNITHDASVEETLKAFRPNEARFLRPSMYRFTKDDVLQLVCRQGLEVYTRPDGRIFPTNGTAKDVVAALSTLLSETGVSVWTSNPVSAICSAEGRVSGVKHAGGELTADRVIIAVGGSSYPATGTTGDGFKWAREMGHTVVRVRPALAPLILDPVPAAGWAGISLRDILLKARNAKHVVARWRGDMLFTHKGISGPTVLGITREVAEALDAGPIHVVADLVPDETFEALNERIKTWCSLNPRKRLAGLVDGVVAARMVESVLEYAGVSPDTAGAYLERSARSRLVEVLKAYPLGRVHQVPIEKGEVVAGGVSLDEVDPRTMESRRIRGLFLCGEVLDIAGPVGGYNLQAAFSTGYVAGDSAASPV